MVNSESIGARLKRARVERSISLEDAHKQTKIQLEVLAAIESDNFSGINPVYLRGFLKIYSRFLNVEIGDPVLEKKHAAPQVRKPEEPAKAKKSAAVQADLRSRIIPPLIAAVLLGVALFCLIAGVRFLAARIGAKKNVRHAQIVRMKKEKIAARKAETKPIVKAPVAAAKEEQVPQEDSIRLGVRALDDCWLQLKADNKVIFQNILKRGRFESWEAKNRIDMTLGSAGGVQIEINGKLIPPLGKRGQVLKNIVITRKDGLQVGK